MTRTQLLSACLIAAAVLPATASAQTPAPGRLLPAEFAQEPSHVPAPPVGKYPEHWAECVQERKPAPPVLPVGIDPRAVDPAATNPLLGLTYFVDRMEPAYMSWSRWKRAGEDAKASTIWKLAREPRFRWFGKFTRPHMQKKVRGFLDRVQCDQPGTVPLMAVMRHQGKDCGGHYRAGGEAEDQATMRWYDDLASAIGNDKVVIAFEPDSLGTIDCLAPSRRDDRLRMLRHGVDVLSQLPNATIYLEAGASDWEPARRTARQLRAIGIARVRGFMLNATHYDWTRNNIRHGLDISRRVGGKPFIINTAENGRGPIHYRAANGRRINVWCNPPRRGLGIPPTTNTSNPMVDAYLWINRPGYAQGCQGRPIAWFAPRALSYARFATRWESPPPGTRRGFRVR